MGGLSLCHVFDHADEAAATIAFASPGVDPRAIARECADTGRSAPERTIAFAQERGRGLASGRFHASDPQAGARRDG